MMIYSSDTIQNTALLFFLPLHNVSNETVDFVLQNLLHWSPMSLLVYQNASASNFCTLKCQTDLQGKMLQANTFMLNTLILKGC